MEEANGGRIARRDDGGLTQAVQAGVRGADTNIGDVTPEPGGTTLRVIGPPMPLHPVSGRKKPVHLLDAHRLQATKLVHATARGSLLSETHRVHPPDHTQTEIIVKRQTRLVEYALRPRAARLAGSVQPDASLAGPDKQRPDTRCERDGRMRHHRAGFSENTGDCPHGNLGSDPGFVGDNEGAVLDVDPAARHPGEGCSVLQGYGTRRPRPLQAQARLSSSMPQP